MVSSGKQAPPVSGWTRSVEFAGRCVVAVSIVLVFVGSCRPMVREFHRLELVGGLGLIGLALVQLLVAALILSQRNALVTDLAVMLAAGVALICVLAGQPAGPWRAEWWPTSAVHTVQLYVLAFGGRYRWILGAAAVVLYAGLRLVATVRTGDPLVLGLVEIILGVQLSLTLVLAVLAMRSAAERHDRAEAERIAELAADEAQQREERQGREVNRFLHDEVIHSLRAIALPRDRVSADHARGAAMRTATRLGPGWRGQTASPTVVEQTLSAVAADLGLRVSIHGRLAGLREDVARAIELAGTEALRNVARHAGTDRVRIRLTDRRERVAVLISDDGCGFDTTEPGSGLRESVYGRMTEVGGHAAVDSGPGGTTVELTWTPEDVDRRVARTWAELTRALTPMVWPGIVGLGLVGVLLLREMEKPLLLAGGLLVVTAVGLGASRRPERRLPPAAVPILLAAALIGVITNFLAVPADTDNGYHLLMAGGVAPLLTLMAIHHPLRWSMPGLVLVWGSVVGLGVWRFGWDAMTGSLSGALLGPLIVLSVILLKGLLRRVARRTLITQDAAIHSRLNIGESARRRLADDDRLKRTRDRVLPFLAAVADGTLDPGDPATAARAAGLETTVREELRWGRTHQAVARAADRARALGWQLELRLTEPELERNAEQVVGLLEALGRPAGSGAVVLSGFGGLSAVVRSPAPEVLERWRGHDDLWVREAEDWCRLVVQAPVWTDVPEREDSPRPEEGRRLTV